MNIQLQNNQPYVEQWRLRRLAPRALRALQNHKNESPPLSSFEFTLIPSAENFIKLYDAAKNVKTIGGQDILEGHQSIAELKRLVRGWLGPLSRDLPGFDSTSYTERLVVPDDVIAMATRLLDLIVSEKENVQAAAEGDDAPRQPLPYLDDAIESLSAAIATAEKEWGENQALLNEAQKLLAQTRDAAVAFQKDLVAFRRALRNAVGSSHRDYQALRTDRGRDADSESDEDADQADETIAASSAASAPIDANPVDVPTDPASEVNAVN